jgi:biopolymer transport protein ExbD
MLLRLLAVLLVLAVAFAFTSSVAIAEDKEKTAEGTVVKAGDGKLTIEDKDSKEHSCSVAKDAKITCDGKECKLDDLKKGVKVKVTLAKKMATRIEATTK